MRARPPPPPSPPVPPPFGSFQFGTLHAVLSFVAILVVRWLWQSWRREAAARAAWERGRALEQAREALSHVLSKRGYTEAELRSYDGVGADRPILLAADGKVFNVTRGQHFYGEDNCYHALAGKDATRLLAKGILRAESEEEATKPLQDHELATLKEWVELYETKCAAAARTRQRRSNRIASILARVRRYVLLGPLLPPVRHDVVDERDADDWRIVETAGAESGPRGPAAPTGQV